MINCFVTHGVHGVRRCHLENRKNSCISAVGKNIAITFRQLMQNSVLAPTDILQIKIVKIQDGRRPPFWTSINRRSFLAVHIYTVAILSVA